jgi:glycosyltransferase involved in cell wall biosynthesis
MGCFSFGLLHTLPEIARDSGTPDFIIASSPHPYVWPAALRYARGVGARCILEVRDIWPQSLVDLAAVSRHHPLIRFTSLIEGRSYRQSDAVVSLLPFSRQYMIGKGVDPARWYHIPNGVEASSAYAPETPSSCLELARAKRASGQHVLVYAGALGRPNGVDSLLRGLAAAGDRATDVHAIIVGRGEMVSQLRALTVALGLKSRVSIFEQISKEATLSLLREVSAGYLSLIAEPVFDFGISPNKLFDYMLAGIPVVAAVDAPNNPVIEADCGLVADPDDANSIARAILELFSMTKEARYDMGRRAQRYVLERHAYDQLASKYLRLMADL